MLSRLVFLHLIIVLTIDGLNILHVVPALSRSHLIFNYNFGQTLANRGYNVTLLTLFPIPGFEQEAKRIKAPMDVTEIRFYPKVNQIHLTQFIQIFQNFTYKVPSLVEEFQIEKLLTNFFSAACEQIIYNETFVEQLRQVKFHLGFTHYYDVCPVVLFDTLKIEKKIVFSAGTFIMEYVAYFLGLPSAPSFIPQSESKFTDSMSFMERGENLVQVLFSFIVYLGTQKQNNLYQEFIQNDNADVSQLYDDIVTYFINGERALEFPRPLHNNILFLGDLSAKKLKADLSKKPVLESPEWKSILRIENKGVILFSLGSIAKMEHMPDRTKSSIISAFSHFPEYTILWKYDGPTPKGLNNTHIYIMDWLPQTELLAEPKTKLFITHGGYNSLLEATHAAIPMIFIPLFADQHVNALKAQKKHLGLIMSKEDITEEDLVHTMKEILTKPLYKESCVKFSSMLQDKPGDPLDGISLYLKHAHVNGWHNKRSLYGKQLTILQYFCLDVILLWSTLSFIVIRSWLYFINLTLIFMRWK